MPALRIGIQTRSLRLPLRRALHTAAQLGASGVEIDLRHELRPGELSQTGMRELRKLLSDLNLRVSAAAFPTRRGYGDAEDLERRVLATLDAMRLAYQLGTNVLVNSIGPIPEDETGPRWQRLHETLLAVAAGSERIGVRLAARTGAECGPVLARFLEKLPEGSVGADLHPADLIRGGHSPSEAVDALGPYILHVHACDAVHDFADRRVIDVPLGRGSTDLPQLLGRLEEFDYRGWITIERPDSPDPVGEIGDAVAFLRSM